MKKTLSEIWKGVKSIPDKVAKVWEAITEKVSYFFDEHIFDIALWGTLAIAAIFMLTICCVGVEEDRKREEPVGKYINIRGERYKILKYDYKNGGYLIDDGRWIDPMIIQRSKLYNFK